MHPIATLTMNPALDLSTVTERVGHTHKVRCGPARFDPGGGGINVARVVKVLGGEATAVYPAGGPHGVVLHRSLDALGLAQRIVPIGGMTRESFTVTESATGNQYRFVLPGPVLSDSEQHQCLEAVAALEPRPSYLVVSGGFTPGADADVLCTEIGWLAEKIGARLILDISMAMRHAPSRGTYLMKPSIHELSVMLGRPIESRAETIAAARSLVADGRTEVVVVSLGSEGALLVTDTLAEHFLALEVPSKSAVGAGDSMVGAIVLALEKGWSLTEAVRYGVAAGTATIMTPGTELCYRADVEQLFAAMGGTPG
jgi:6-phosphofructokinase 2